MWLFMNWHTYILLITMFWAIILERRWESQSPSSTFDTLQQLDPAWLCNKYEFLADLMTMRSMGDLATPGY